MGQSLKWYIDRLSVMSPDEVAQRFWSIYLKKTEKGALAKVSKVDFRISKVEACPKLPKREGCCEVVAEAIHTEAAKVLQGHWDVLRGLTWQVDTSSIDWTRDYLNNEQCLNTVSAHEINHRAIEGFDARASWEPSRFIQLVRVAQSAWLEPTDSSAKTTWVIDTLEDWYQKNPLGRGIQWTSPMEPALRLINIAWLDALISEIELEQSEKERWQKVLQSLLPGHVWWVWRYRSFGSSANNHLLGELAGLALTLNRWPELEQFSTTRSDLKRRVEHEILSQFHEDGGNIEEALHYHHFAWEMVWQSHKAFESSALGGFAQSCVERMARAAQFFVDLGEADEPWDFGDSDDAHITPLYASERTATHEWKAFMKGQDSAVSYWLGDAPMTDYSPDQLGNWRHYPESNYLVAQTDTGLKCRLDASNLGMGKMAAHGHIDALHLSVWDDHQAVIIDPGTGGYFGHDEKRLQLAAKESHNTPFFKDDSVYPRRGGLFMWCGSHKKPEVHSEGQEVEPTLELEWDEKHSIKRNVTLTDNLVEVKDEVRGSSSEGYIHWIFAPEWELEKRDGKIIATRGDVSWELSFDSAQEATIEVGAQMASPSYGVFTDAPRVKVAFSLASEKTTLTTRFKKVS